jgi:hypothetical protein
MITLAGAGALLGAACSSSNGTPHSDGGAGSGGGGNPFTGLELVPTNTGFVQDATSGIVGAWYAYGDSVGPNANTTTTDSANSDCVSTTKGNHAITDCSQIAMPTPGQPFAPDPVTGAMCTTGTAAKVLNDSGGNPDYSNMWGSGIALDFNNPGGDAGVKGTYDLSNYTGIAFVFTGSVIPMGKIRVNFPFTGEHGQDSPYYKGATIDNSMLTNNQQVTVKWADVGGPLYLTQQMPPTTPPPFDKTKAQSIQWQVFTNTTAATPYSFCINHLTLLSN